MSAGSMKQAVPKRTKKLRKKLAKSSLTKRGSGQPGYHIKIGGSGSKTQAAKWKTTNGKIGLLLESQNSLQPMNAYLEFRNRARRDAWGVGLKTDSGFHIGYGMLGTFTKKAFIKMSPNKAVTFFTDTVFHKRPSYFKPGSQLKLRSLASAGVLSTKPRYGKKLKAKAKSAHGVPDIPLRTDRALGSNGAAEPLVAYYSRDDISIRVTAETTGAPKEAFIEFKSQKKTSWRIAVHSDNDLHITYHSTGQGAGTTMMKITRKGAVHIYGEASFAGAALKQF